jgi:RHS repeat-associated protein
VAYFDTLGRTFLTVADNGNGQKFKTHVELDLEGNQRSVKDALDRIVMKYDYDMLGDRIHQASMEAGDRWMLNNVAGKPMRMWDSREHILRTTYDELQRPTQLFVKIGNNPEFLAEKTIYGEGQGAATNHRGRIYRHFDGAGVATNVEFDFKGNLVSSSRQLVQDYKTVPNWSGNPALETEIFTSSTRYDALNRPIQLVAPHSSLPNAKLNVIRPGYNEANLLERMDVWLGEAVEPTALLVPQSANFHAVVNIDRDAKGQRTLIEYGNGAKTEYTYDPQTFRLVHLKTTRGAALLQDLFYTYDPVGNIARIQDKAQQTNYFKNQVVMPHCDYSYDPIYRLIEAMGREHIGQAGQPQETKWDDEFRVNLPHPGDGQAMRNYTEQYVYDAVGNFEKLIHQAANGSWTRAYAYNEESLIEPGKLSNRLSSTTVGARTEPYSYDAHGNMTAMPHLALMQWNYKDELSATARQVVNDAPPPNLVPETTFYVYDAGGERVRKVTEGQNGKRKHERIYLGGFEIYREFKNDGDIKLERETLHVMDDKQRIALVETKTITNPDDESPTQLIRYQLGNHLGSASLELDDRGNVISYEEYYPYGSTAYQAVDKGVKAAAKQYRYTGKERDEETGLAYHGARYYAAWLGQWCSSDPAGLVDGDNTYIYCRCNPIILSDPSGMDSITFTEEDIQAHPESHVITVQRPTVPPPTPPEQPTGSPDRTAPLRPTVSPEVADLPANNYVDAFESAHYDLDYRATGGNLSTWLQVQYRDGTTIDISTYDIHEDRPDASTTLGQMSRAHVGEGGRIFPEQMNASTTPRLAAARRSAIESMEESNYEFMMAALPAVLFIIFTAGAPMSRTPVRSTPRLPRVRLRTPPLTSGQMGNLIGWGTGQSAEAVAKTVNVTRQLTQQRVAQLAQQGLTRQWVEQQLSFYTRALGQGGGKLNNAQLLPRKQLMEKLLELWR